MLNGEQLLLGDYNTVYGDGTCVYTHVILLPPAPILTVSISTVISVLRVVNL